MKWPDKRIGTKPLLANSKGVTVAVERNHAIADAPSDAGSYAPHANLILAYLDAYGTVFIASAAASPTWLVNSSTVIIGFGGREEGGS